MRISPDPSRLNPLSLSLAQFSSAQRTKQKKKTRRTHKRARALCSLSSFSRNVVSVVGRFVWSAYKETLFFSLGCVVWGARKAQKERKYLSTGSLNSIQNPKLLFFSSFWI
jgi:hypothetical protein